MVVKGLLPDRRHQSDLSLCPTGMTMLVGGGCGWWEGAVAAPPLHPFSSTHLMPPGVLAQRLWEPGVGPHLNPFLVFASGRWTRRDTCPVVPCDSHRGYSLVKCRQHR